MAVAGTAFAAPMPAPAVKAQPRPASTAIYSGKWYEIARTPNSMEGDCQAGTYEFSNWAAGAFKAVQTCHKGAPTGPVKVMKVDGKVLPASQNAKIQLGIMGGLISQEYWILDHASDNAWLIMSTANQHYVWLMSRAPALSAAQKAAALARVQQLGFDLARLSFPQQQLAAR
jgi:apolipoprotein D and lipocalin family protein